MNPVHILKPHSLKFSFNISYQSIPRSRNSAVGITTACGPEGGGVRVSVQVGAGFLSSPRCPDRFWGPTSLLANEYRELFLRGKAAEACS
jgi:hypothetical protein